VPPPASLLPPHLSRPLLSRRLLAAPFIYRPRLGAAPPLLSLPPRPLLSWDQRSPVPLRPRASNPKGRLMPFFPSLPCPQVALLTGVAFPLPSLLLSAPHFLLSFTPLLPSPQPPLLRVPQGALPLLPLLRSGGAGGLLRQPLLQEAQRTGGLLLLLP
jgi:hypothetical protein